MTMLPSPAGWSIGVSSSRKPSHRTERTTEAGPRGPAVIDEKETRAYALNFLRNISIPLIAIPSRPNDEAVSGALLGVDVWVHHSSKPLLATKSLPGSPKPATK